MFTQRFVGAPQFGGLKSIGQTETPVEMPKLQVPQLPSGAAGMQNAGTQLNTMLTQQAGQLQQAQETVSNLWWSMNWPYVAGAAALLGLAGILIWKKA